jgi:Spy/CpxP family protein refolding chaperone
MKNVVKCLFIAFLIPGFFLTPLAYAQDAQTPGGNRYGWQQNMRSRMREKRQDIYSQLNLTQEQKKRLDDNRLKNREKIKEMMEKARSERVALNQELLKPKLDMNTINEIKARLNALYTQMTEDRLNSILEVRNVLTPEQFAKFISITQNQGMRNRVGGNMKPGDDTKTGDVP